MRTIQNILYFIIVLCTITSCEDFLIREPLSSLTPSSFFTNERELSLYANSFYNVLPSGLSFVSTDEMGEYTSKNISPAFIAGNYSSINEGSWSWSALRNINYFLEHSNNPNIAENTRRHYQGIARFFRAYFYYNKVQTYGDVPWYSCTLSTSDEELLYKKRDKREAVMDSVLLDLNFACQYINDTKDATASTVTRQVALAFKSRVCLFEGTYRKYHTQLNLTGTADKWLTEAANAALTAMESGRYLIYNTGAPDNDYRTLFTSENPVSTEVMWAIVYNNALRKWHDITWQYNSVTFGSRWGLNKQFINTYLMNDGSRFSDREGFDTIQFVREMKDRDCRLAQTVRSLGYKRSNGMPAPPNFGYTFTGYHIHKFSLDDSRLDGVTESYNSIPIMRYAEVLLNYAEAMAERGLMTEEIWGKTIAPLRERANVVSSIPSTADTYLQEVYFPEITDKYLLEIRRERGVELVYEALRYQDLMRWKKGKLIEMSWKGIYVPEMDLPMDLDGNGTPDVAFVSIVPETKVPGVIYYIIDGKSSRLTEGNKGHVTWRDDEARKFDYKKYLRPISNNDIVINPNILPQNPGWE